QPAVPDRELVAVECPRRRAGRAVALRVELAPVAGRAEAGRWGRDEPALAGVRSREAALVDEERPVGLCRAADVRAAARHDREARQLSERPVVADERRAA